MPNPEFEPQIFKREVRHSDHCGRGPLLSKHFAFSFSLFALAAKTYKFSLGCRCEKKNNFQALKNGFIRTAVMKLRQARL